MNSGTRVFAQAAAKRSQGKRVGSGKESDGGFCSLDCYGEYYKAELMERHKKAIAAAERHRNS